MMYKSYDEQVRRSNEADYKAFIKTRFLSVFEENNCQSILDVGCGQGVLLDLLSEAGKRGVGIELDEGFVEDLRQRGREVLAGDALQVMESITETFDGIFIAHLIEHLPPAESMKLLDLAYRVLNPGGLIMMVTPNVQSIIQHVQIFYRDYTHVRFYPADLIKFLMGQVGFKEFESGEIQESAYLNPQKVTPVSDRPKTVTTRMPSLTSVRKAREKWDLAEFKDAMELTGVTSNGAAEKFDSQPKSSQFFGLLRRLIRRWLGIEDTDQLAKEMMAESLKRVQQINKLMVTNEGKFAMEVTKAFEVHQELLTKYAEQFNDLVAKTVNTQDMVKRHAEVVNFLLRNALRPNDIYVIARKPAESVE